MQIVDSQQGGDPYLAKQPNTVSAADIPGMDMERLLPRQISTGSMRGTQTVGYGGVKIDGSNNRISIDANGTNISIGDTSNTDNVTGLSLIDNKSGNNLVLLGATPAPNPTNGLSVFDGTNTRRLLAGVYPNGEVKIKLSRDKFDVATATDDQLIWSSDFNMFKIVKTANVTITVPNSPGDDYGDSVTVIHNLGYKPAYLAYVSPPQNYLTFVGSGVKQTMLPFFQYIYFDSANPPTLAGWHIKGRVDVTGLNDTSITFGLNFTFTTATDYSGDWIIRYYLLKETAG